MRLVTREQEKRLIDAETARDPWQKGIPCIDDSGTLTLSTKKGVFPAPRTPMPEGMIPVQSRIRRIEPC